MYLKLCQGIMLLLRPQRRAHAIARKSARDAHSHVLVARADVLAKNVTVQFVKCMGENAVSMNGQLCSSKVTVAVAAAVVLLIYLHAYHLAPAQPLRPLRLVDVPASAATGLDDGPLGAFQVRHCV